MKGSILIRVKGTCAIVLLLLHGGLQLIYGNTNSSETWKKPWEFHYLLNNEYNSSCPCCVDILIWVHTKPENYHKRHAIRSTWGNYNHLQNKTLFVLFFVGITTKENDDLLIYENEKYRDIIMEDYIDTYRNISYKAMSALRWVTNYCVNSTHTLQYLLKADDDVVVDMQDLDALMSQKLLAKGQLEPLTMFCPVAWKGPVWRKHNKWKVSEREFNRTVYPPHCQGFGIVISPDLIHRLWEESRKTEFFWIDDVFFTGILVEHLGVNFVASWPYFARAPPKEDIKSSGFVLIHMQGAGENSRREIWQKFLSRHR